MYIEDLYHIICHVRKVYNNNTTQQRKYTQDLFQLSYDFKYRGVLSYSLVPERGPVHVMCPLSLSVLRPTSAGGVIESVLSAWSVCLGLWSLRCAPMQWYRATACELLQRTLL